MSTDKSTAPPSTNSAFLLTRYLGRNCSPRPGTGCEAGHSKERVLVPARPQLKSAFLWRSVWHLQPRYRTWRPTIDW